MFPVRHGGAGGSGGDMLAPRDRTKHTLGDVLGEIESRSASLLQQTDYAVPRAVADLQFLAHQSRYSTDLNIKRRIITKLVDSGLINIIVHMLCGASEALDYYYDQTSSDTADRTSLTGSVDAESHEVDQLSDGMKNLRAVITLAWNATDKSSLLCQQCVGRGVISMLLRLLDSPRLAVSELLHATDKTRMFIVKGCLGVLGCIVRSCDDDTTHEVCREFLFTLTL